MRVHFLDARTGKRTRPDFRARDIIKGSVTLDPDGYPLIYFGARDGRFRVVSFDRKRPKELWALRARDYKGPDNDFDSSAVIVDGILFVGGENGYLFAIELNRSYDARGVRVEPEILLAMRTWTREYVKKAGDRRLSVESSVTILEDRLYVTNGLGRVMGVDISKVREGKAPVVFDYWTGEDTDATMGGLGQIEMEAFEEFAMDPLERCLGRVTEHPFGVAHRDRVGHGAPGSVLGACPTRDDWARSIRRPASDTVMPLRWRWAWRRPFNNHKTLRRQIVLYLGSCRATSRCDDLHRGGRPAARGS